jgi:5-methyltetrahydropteroyltriglutamate--homocysteine methyltransferase
LRYDRPVASSRRTIIVVAGARAKPPFRADHVGSFLRPASLAEARRHQQEGKLSREELRRIEDDCIRDVVAMQEKAGLKGITDGDFRRGDWFVDFMFAFDGVTRTGESAPVEFSGGVTFRAPVATVTGRLACPDGGVMVEDFRFLASIVRQTPKLAIPAPAMFYSLLDARALDRTIYPDADEFWSDLSGAYAEVVGHFARAGCRYLQIDDVNSTNVADSKRQQFWRGRGLEPQQLVDTFIDLNNAALASRPKDMTVAVHMCRGNFQSQWVGEGTYDMVAERYFNRMNVDAFFLEYDDARSGGFQPLRFMPQDKVVVLGLMTSKTPALESKDELKRRVDEAARYVSIERLCISPQCGFASTQEGNRLTHDQQVRKLEHLVQVAEEIWGGV